MLAHRPPPAQTHRQINRQTSSTSHQGGEDGVAYATDLAVRRGVGGLDRRVQPVRVSLVLEDKLDHVVV